jgi:hypothetical protein
MDCPSFRNNLFAYLENGLSQALSEEFREHARRCSTCAAVFEGFRSEMDSIRLRRQEEPDPYALSRISHKVESVFEKPLKQGFPSWAGILRPVAVAVLFLAAVLIGFSVGKKGTSAFTRDGVRQEIESMRSDLFLSDFMDENKTF